MSGVRRRTATIARRAAPRLVAATLVGVGGLLLASPAVASTDASADVVARGDAFDPTARAAVALVIVTLLAATWRRARPSG